MTSAREVVIAGAGNLAALLFDCMDEDPRWRPISFVDDNRAGARLFGLPVFHPRDERVLRGATAVMAVGAPGLRKDFVEGLGPLGLDWQTYIDRRSHVSKACELGDGSIVMPFATVGPGATIGRFAYLGAYASVGGKAEIGEFTTLLPRSSAGGCRIGAGSTLGVNSACLDGTTIGEAVVVAPFTWVRNIVPSRSFVANLPGRVAIRRR